MSISGNADLLITIMFLLYILFFIANPLMSLCFLYVAGISNDKLGLKYQHALLNLGGWLCAFFVSIINMVKVPENDLETYLGMYSAAGEYPLLNYIVVASSANLTESFKEPCYGIIVWVMYHIFSGDESLFKLFLSLMNYLILNYSIILFGKKTHLFPFWIILTGLFYMTFIPWIFTMSLQLLRQFLAGSFLVYLLIRIFFYQKKDYWLMVIMVFVHSSAWLFIPFLLIKTYEKPFKEAKLCYILTIGGLLSIKVLSILASRISFLSNVPMINYVFGRASTNQEFEDVSFSFLLFMMLIIVLLYSIHLNVGSRFSSIEGVRRFSFFLIILCIFIIINIDQQGLAQRFMFYSYPLIPFLLMFLIKELNINKFFVSVLTLLLVVFFTIFLEIGTWSYDIWATVWIAPVFTYFSCL